MPERLLRNMIPVQFSEFNTCISISTTQPGMPGQLVYLSTANITVTNLAADLMASNSEGNDTVEEGSVSYRLLKELINKVETNLTSKIDKAVGEIKEEVPYYPAYNTHLYTTTPMSRRGCVLSTGT